MAPPTLTIRQIIDRLVGYDTTSASSNLALIEFIANYLDGYGVAAVRVENDEGTKANLIASVGPEVRGGVVLSGHTDVVPVVGQNWKTDPFTVVAEDERLYGRGTADMKSFIAVALALVPEFLDQQLVVPIHFAFSYDEEVGCLGAPRLLARIGEVCPPPRAAIVGEPTEMKVVGAHRGAALFTTSVTGRPGHSSQPDRGVNAIEFASEGISYLLGLAREFRDHPDAVETTFDPPYATLNVGIIEGGTATNIIAEHCRFRWGCRSGHPDRTDQTIMRFKDHSRDVLMPRMQAIAVESNIVTEQGPRVPPLVADPGSPAEMLALSITGQNGAGTIALASEAGMFQEAGIPAVLCGPGSPTQAHQANEHVPLQDIAACEQFLRKVGEWAATPDVRA